MTGGLLDRVAAGLRERAAAATAPCVFVGDRLLLVAVTHPEHGRLAGIAHRPDGAADGVRVGSVPRLVDLSTTGEDRVARAAGIATLNALSRPDMDWRIGDPMAALPAGVDVVATVGRFGPAFRTFEGVDVRVVERDLPASVDPPPDVSVTTYPPEARAEAFAGADVCFLTGSALVYGGVDRYLSALSAAGVEPVVLVGATASHTPGPAFDAGVDVVAGARVTDVDRARPRVLAGDCATDLHTDGVEKVYVADADGAGYEGLTPAEHVRGTDASDRQPRYDEQ